MTGDGVDRADTEFDSGNTDFDCGDGGDGGDNVAMKSSEGGLNFMK